MVTLSPVKLGSVQKTLLLPLWGRAAESKKANPLLVDRAAARIIGSMDYDFSTIVANTSFITQLSWVARCLHIDRIIRSTLQRFPDAIIVNLGCGLDTTFDRVDNGSLRWYDLDLPDVIALRREYITETTRCRFLACSILDECWMDQVQPTSQVLFIVAGVLYYFNEDEVHTILHRIADRFPGCEMVFDVCSPRGLHAANQRVIRDTGMDSSAVLKWSLRHASELHDWDPRITVLAEFPTFRGLKHSFTLKEKWGTFLCDTLRIMFMVHLAIKPL